MARSHFKYLHEAGVKIYLYSPGFNHEKCMLVDNKICFIGTINLDYRSLVHHFECGTIMYNVPCLKDIAADFEEMFEQSKLVTNPKFRGFLLFAVLNIFAPLF